MTHLLHPVPLRLVLIMACTFMAACETELHNNPPEMPEIPRGPSEGLANVEVTFTASAHDLEGTRVMLRIDWGDGCISDWSRPVSNGTPVSMTHMFFTGGTYGVRAIAMDENQLESIPSGAAVIRITGTGVAGRGDWWTFGHDTKHTHRSAYSGPVIGDTLWTFKTGGKIYSSPVIGIDSTIYIGSDDFHLYALFPDGRLRWSYNAGADIVRSTPAIGVDGTLYVISGDGILHAVSPGGARKWVYALNPLGLAVTVHSSPVIGGDGLIYTCDGMGQLTALSPDGTKSWSIPVGAGDIYSTPTILEDNTLVVGGFTSHVVYGMSHDKGLQWTYGTGANITSSPAVDPSGTIYVGSDILYALRDDGVLLWKYQTSGGILSSPAIGPDGTVYITSIDGTLHALTSAGELKWTLKYADQGGNCSPAVDAKGTIYLGTSQHALYAINPNGSVKWRMEAGGAFNFSSPTIGPGGSLYIGCLDGKVYAIK